VEEDLLFRWLEKLNSGVTCISGLNWTSAKEVVIVTAPCKWNTGSGYTSNFLAQASLLTVNSRTMRSTHVLMSSADGGAKSPHQFKVTDEKVGEAVETFIDTQFLIPG